MAISLERQIISYCCNVIRIVNLDDETTEDSLKHFIQMLIVPTGLIENLYVRKDDILGIIFAYVVFEHSSDAARALHRLNGYYHNRSKLEVALIDPNLQYKKYGGGSNSDNSTRGPRRPQKQALPKEATLASPLPNVTKKISISPLENIPKKRDDRHVLKKRTDRIVKQALPKEATLASPLPNVTEKISISPLENVPKKRDDRNILKKRTDRIVKQALPKEATLASSLQNVTQKIHHPTPVQSNKIKSRLQQIIGPDQDIDRPVHNQGSTASYFARTKPHGVWPKKKPSATIPQYTILTNSRFDGNGEAKQLYSSTSAKSNSVDTKARRENRAQSQHKHGNI
ncbi:hypothetical protein JTB14_035755 [Gonioctena quinquepunctata]|nr:hypothetical protein JTB14_035755 [Gonioctena quinquepunctata]